MQLFEEIQSVKDVFDTDIQETISLVIYGEPKPKQSARHRIVNAKNGKTWIQSYKDSQVVKAEENIKSQIKMQWHGDVIEDALAVTKLHYVFFPIKSMPKFKRLAIERGEIIFKNTKPDLTDNLNKGLFDALEDAKVIANDSQIVSLDNVKKYYGLKPRIELEMKVIDKKHCK